MPYNFVRDSFHTNRRCSRLSSNDVRFYTENGRFACFSPAPPFGGFGAAYDDDLRLIGQCVVDLLLVLSVIFSL